MGQLHDIACPSCGGRIPAADVELSLLLAKCTACDTVFSIAAAVGRSESEVVERSMGDGRPVTPTDHAVTEREEAGSLVLEFRWFGFSAIFLMVFALFWNGFLLVWYSLALGALLSGDTEAIMMVIFPVLHVAAGLGIGYWSLAMLLNKTVVRVDRQGIGVVHGPLPWTGNQQIAVADVVQLYVEPRVVRTKNSSRTVFDLNAVLHSGSLTVVRGLDDARAARYLEHRIEGWLGIVDRPVAGEHLGR